MLDSPLLQLAFDARTRDTVPLMLDSPLLTSAFGARTQLLIHFNHGQEHGLVSCIVELLTVE
jgi:hypothetical protein